MTLADPFADTRPTLDVPDPADRDMEQRLAVCDAVRWLAQEPVLNLFGPYSIAAGWENDADAQDGSILPCVTVLGRRRDMAGVLDTYNLSEPFRSTAEFRYYRARIELDDLPGVPVVSLVVVVQR